MYEWWSIVLACGGLGCPIFLILFNFFYKLKCNFGFSYSNNMDLATRNKLLRKLLVETWKKTHYHLIDAFIFLIDTLSPYSKYIENFFNNENCQSIFYFFYIFGPLNKIWLALPLPGVYVIWLSICSFILVTMYGVISISLYWLVFSYDI